MRKWEKKKSACISWTDIQICVCLEHYSKESFYHSLLDELGVSGKGRYLRNRSIIIHKVMMSNKYWLFCIVI